MIKITSILKDIETLHKQHYFTDRSIFAHFKMKEAIYLMYFEFLIWPMSNLLTWRGMGL